MEWKELSVNSFQIPRRFLKQYKKYFLDKFLWFDSSVLAGMPESTPPDSHQCPLRWRCKNVFTLNLHS